jgi:hypothetical protein
MDLGVRHLWNITVHRVSSAEPVHRQAISDIYTKDHTRYYLLIVALLA